MKSFREFLNEATEAGNKIVQFKRKLAGATDPAEKARLQKAIDDEEIGYEIESEIEDCVRDYLEQITNKTGVNVTIFSSLYK